MFGGPHNNIPKRPGGRKNKQPKFGGVDFINFSDDELNNEQGP